MKKSHLSQAGFTLVELMISIVLGLLITAAATQLFVTGIASLNMQRATADIQDTGNFGLNYLVTDLREANLDAATAVVNDQTAGGGVVFTSTSNRLSNPVTTGGVTTTNSASPNINMAIDPTFLSRGNGQTIGSASLNQWTGASNVNTYKSDQLVIEYLAYQIGTDCDGTSITSTDVANGTYIVQRYFLRTDTDGTLALACDAGRYTVGATSITGFGGTGQIIMRHVDYFHVLLGVSDGAFDSPTNLRYMNINDYMNMTVSPVNDPVTNIPNPRSRVQSIQIGMVVRANDSVRDSLVSDTPTFQVLDQSVTLKTPTAGTPKYLRQVVSQTVAIRNGMGIRGTGDGL